MNSHYSYYNYTTKPTQVYLLFDERMTLHRPPPPSLLSTDKKRRDGEAAAWQQDQQQQHHCYSHEEAPFENSNRIVVLYRRLLDVEDRLLRQAMAKQLKLMPPVRRFLQLQPVPCPRATIELAHTSQHYERMMLTCTMSHKELKDLSLKDSDLYYCKDTFLAATLACGGVVQCVDAVMDAHATGVGPTRAIALVRPPGHHATANKAMGTYIYGSIL